MYTCVSLLERSLSETDRQIPILIGYHSSRTHYASQIWQNPTYTRTIFRSSRQSDSSYAQPQRKLAKTFRALADQVANQATFYQGFTGDGGDEASQEIIDHTESVGQLIRSLHSADWTERRSSRVRRKSWKTTKSG